MIPNLKKCQPVILNYVLRAEAACLQYRNVISERNVYKSANRLYIYAPNVETCGGVPPSVHFSNIRIT
jgi:hypothetical protein